MATYACTSCAMTVSFDVHMGGNGRLFLVSSMNAA